MGVVLSLFAWLAVVTGLLLLTGVSPGVLFSGYPGPAFTLIGYILIGAVLPRVLQKYSREYGGTYGAVGSFYTYGTSLVGIAWGLAGAVCAVKGIPVYGEFAASGMYWGLSILVAGCLLGFVSLMLRSSQSRYHPAGAIQDNRGFVQSHSAPIRSLKDLPKPSQENEQQEG